MCGIAGIWNLDGELVDRRQLEVMTSALAHRGPDGEGFHIEGALGLGHRRLAILDTAPSGAQPMEFAGGKYRITFNGEIYNFLELRAELVGRGHSFRTETDTEVILASYREWGPDCLHRFNGMWAFAIWDRDEQSLFLSRDRFGVKPLFYFWDGRHFAFASEMKAFLALPWFDPTFDKAMVASVIQNIDAVEGSSLCILKELRNLQAGHSLIVKKDSTPRLQRWWRTVDHLVDVPSDFAEQAQVFRELFLDAVRIRMRSDVPVACSVSGGLDSSSVLCAMSAARLQGDAGERQAASWRSAYFSWYPGTINDERRFAEDAIERAGATPHILEMNPDDLPAILDSFIFQVEEVQSPHPGPWLLYREMRRSGICVSLEGHGGDELVAGYLHHVIFARDEALRSFLGLGEAANLTALFRRMTSGGKDRITGRDVKKIIQLLALRLRRRAVRGLTRGDSCSLAPARSAGEAMNLENVSLWLKLMPRTDGVDAIPEEETESLAPLNALLYQDFHGKALRTILRDFDRYSMAHGIETRCPFVDYRLVTFTFSLPPSSFLRDGQTKSILRRAMCGILPESIRTRTQKRGYKAPFGEWWKGDLRTYVRDTVGSKQFVESDIWDGPGIRKLVEEAPPGVRFPGALPVLRFVVADRLMTLFKEARARRIKELVA